MEIPQSIRSLVPVAAVATVLIAGAVVGILGQVDASESLAAIDRPAPDDPGPSPADVVRDRTPEERERQRSALPPNIREGHAALEQYIADGTIPVAGPNGFVGYIDIAAWNEVDGAAIHPVRDESGRIVAYWAGAAAGVIDKELVESGEPIDFDAVRRSNGFGEAGHANEPEEIVGPAPPAK